MHQPILRSRLKIYLPKKCSYIILFINMLLSAGVLLSFRSEKHRVLALAKKQTNSDSVSSKKAFLRVYAVLMSPRCINCHPAGDVPLQGDDSHPHTQGVKRGIDGKGIYALKCANCHQVKNLPGVHMPPGNPNWSLPPANMKMIFQGRTPHQLALQLLDKKKNGGKSTKALVDHITKDGLVLSAWNPADGMAKPPMSHAAFVSAFNEWISKGALSP